ncbi:MAG TPA: hypothetical protein VGO22_03750 [Pseudorhizobium sp.]|nr:hypothetical protein [Pseudorhizobium sp.]
MIASNDMPVPRKPVLDTASERGRLKGNDDLVERLARELRLRSDPHLPHEFYIEQVRRQLAGRMGVTGAPVGDQILGTRTAPLQSASVFHAWAMPD